MEQNSVVLEKQIFPELRVIEKRVLGKSFEPKMVVQFSQLSSAELSSSAQLS